MQSIKVIDLFAGPGGLGEGFSAFRAKEQNPFKIAVSIEKDREAWMTLRLRSLFRKLHTADRKRAFFDILQQADRTLIDRLNEIHERFPAAFHAAEREAVCTTLSPGTRTSVNRLIQSRLNGDSSILIGGPPCQAYSMAGRSRNRGNIEYEPEKDDRHFLYREYLQAIFKHRPLVFVMENVRGLLSAKVGQQRIFEQMTRDLKNPKKALERDGCQVRRRRGPAYELFSLTESDAPSLLSGADVEDFIVRMEDYGIPQARHRLIILGIRRDLLNDGKTPGKLRPAGRKTDAAAVLEGLPKLRSGLSREQDSFARWRSILLESDYGQWAASLAQADAFKGECRKILSDGLNSRLDRGGEFISDKCTSGHEADWYRADLDDGVFNHSSRAHIAEDLHRYLFTAVYGRIHGVSPRLRHFPPMLLPKHRNVNRARSSSNFLLW